MPNKIKTQPTNQSSGPAGGDDVDKIVSQVGQKLLKLRTEQGMSLQQLAAKSDVSGPAIHKIERSFMVPTITTLLKLSNALGTPINYFTDDGEDLPEPVLYTKSDERAIVFTPHKGLHLEGITGPYKQFKTAAARATMSPGAHSGRKLLRHPGEELVFVIAGEIKFVVGPNEYRLQAGDALHFSGELSHSWSNPTEIDAELIWVVLRND